VALIIVINVVRYPTASNTPNLCTQLTLKGAFVGCKISLTNNMVPCGKKIHSVTNCHVLGGPAYSNLSVVKIQPIISRHVSLIMWKIVIILQ